MAFQEDKASTAHIIQAGALHSECCEGTSKGFVFCYPDVNFPKRIRFLTNSPKRMPVVCNQSGAGVQLASKFLF